MKSLLEKLDKLPLREKLALALALVFAICWLLDWCVVRSFVRRLKDLDVRIEQAKASRIDSLCLLARQKELKAEFDRIGNAVVKAASPAEAFAGMKSELYETAKQTGLAINAMDQKESKDKDSKSPKFYEEYIVEISKFNAEMKDLTGFLYRVDTSPGMTRVVKLNIIPGKSRNSTTGSLLLTKVMIVDSASRPVEAASTAVNPPPPAKPKK